MKVRASVKRLCQFCRVVKRRGHVYILCKARAKHKQRQGYSTNAYEAPLPQSEGPSQIISKQDTLSNMGSIWGLRTGMVSQLISKQEPATKMTSIWGLRTGLACLLSK